MTQDDERFNTYLQRLARELDPAPETPREEMWARIDALRRPLRPQADDGSGVIALADRRGRRLLRWAAALAAILALGIAIGRLSLLRERTGGAPVATAADPAAAADSAEQAPYRLAAAEYLARTEVLLTALPTDAETGNAEQVAGWAGELLTDTRLLMDSPAGRDPELRRLLEDIELVLAQIAALPGDGPAAEVQMIQDGIDRRYVLLRLRAATAMRSAAAS